MEGSTHFSLSEEGKKIEGFLPEANCNRCSHFKTCAIWRQCAGVQQAGLPIKLEDFLKTLPRICPEYEVKVEQVEEQ